MTGAALRLGTRGSDLALWQARHVADLVKTKSGVECSIEIIKTRGDRIQDVAFRKMEGKGFFTKELQEALLENRVDLVVHSLKDLPTDEPRGLAVAAILERGNPHDLLLARQDLIEPNPSQPMGLPDGAVVGTSSLRRAAQTLAHHPRVEIRALRGNVPTRVRKLHDGDYDAILLAAAGVERLKLDLSDLDTVELTPEIFLPAPGQGALAVETRDDGTAREIIGGLHDRSVARQVECERGLLELLGGGCHLPLGCLASHHESGIRLQSALGDIDDKTTHARVARVGSVARDPETAARICFEALRLAMPEVVAS